MWESWNQFWWKRESGHALAGFRILFGLYLLQFFLLFLPKVEVAFSSYGVYVPHRIPDLGLPPGLAWMLYGLTLAVIAAFTLGFVTRLITPILTALYIYYYLLNFATRTAAFDRLTLFLLLMACLSDLDRVWSITARLRPAAAASRTVPVWAARTIQLQFSFFYLFSGLFKLSSHSWHQPEMLYWTFCGIWATPLAQKIVSFGLPLWFYGVLAWSVMLFEIFMAVAIWVPKLRLWACFFGVLFHVSNIVFLGIPEFLNCVATYPLFFPAAQVLSGFGRNRALTR